MAIKLSPETTKQLHASIKRYVAENLDQAIADAQSFFQGRLADLEGVCYEKEFTYWAPADRGRKP